MTFPCVSCLRLRLTTCLQVMELPLSISGLKLGRIDADIAVSTSEFLSRRTCFKASSLISDQEFHVNRRLVELI